MRHDGWLEGKVAVITGGANGMGRATAVLFAQEGARVVVADVDQAAGQQVASEIIAQGGQALFVPCDVSSEPQVQALMAAAVQTFGGVDTLFNNAGVEQPVTPSHEVSVEMFDRIIGINLRGSFLCAKHAIPLMLQAGGGTIVNNSSVSAFANVGGNLSYGSSKGALMSMTRILAIEYADRNIRVNAICPGVIDTPMNQRNLDKAGYENQEEVRQRWMKATPLGRMGTPEEIARTVLYLASDMSSFTTGIGLLIDGGRVAT
jgi:NAD(P)-dependent dehydrogenase (short-subunit alcohol dehydrogenase family)